ncbi:MAG: universal stress protein [Acidobacteria bacterium]|nr:universal stress protein [Acidobacteriota bacterium]
MFAHILAPVDFSPLSALGLRYARLLADCSQARVTVLFADTFSPPAYFTASLVDELAAQFRDSMREAETRLRQFAADALGGSLPAGIEFKVVEGMPAEVIAGFAAAHDAGLIAMGTHGRSGFNRFLLGSVAERVLRESAVPVLTVRGDGRASPSIRNILCPVNDSEAARQSLHVATEMAQCLGATVTLLHVREPGADNSINDLCAWAPAAQRARCTVRELVRDGEAAAEIVRFSSSLPCDLVVMGSRHRAFFDSTVIGTTTARVVRHAACPVLTVVQKPAATINSEVEEKRPYAV